MARAVLTHGITGRVVLAAYDDGSRVELEAYSGGGSIHGAWARVTLVKVLKTGEEYTRDYMALGSWASREVQADERQEAEHVATSSCFFCEGKGYVENPRVSDTYARCGHCGGTGNAKG